jgi:pimeloyl-ACP methyl ester carboxylesterase
LHSIWLLASFNVVAQGTYKPGIAHPITRLRREFPWLLLLGMTVTALAADGPSHPVAPAPTPPAIVIGFVGGFVHPDDARHSEVQLAHRLSSTYPALHSEIFDNRHRKDAYHAIVHWLDTDEDGKLSDAERHASRIVIFGHSWGAAAALDLARDLQRANIPVLLTVQVDSINKIGQDDRLVPSNVAKAVNFYQTRGLLHGRPEIAAADPAHTEILGQFRFDYAKLPAECSDYAWLTRHLFKGHTAIECDSNVWSQISQLIDATLTQNSRPLVSAASLAH